MSREVYEDFNLDEYLIIRCDMFGCTQEKRILINKLDLLNRDKKLKLPPRSEDDSGWESKILQDDDGRWLREDYCPECAKKIAEEKKRETTTSINELIKEAHKTAEKHGWWNKRLEFGTLIALCHSELSEALEDYRNGKPIDKVFFDMVEIDEEMKKKPTGVPIELADVCIRIFDLCGFYGIDLEAAIREKMEYNKGRSYRHGGKKC